MSFDKDKQNGGQVFPSNGVSTGMTLRDYFASKVMQAYVTDPETQFDPESVELAVRICYRISDAMLKERGKQ